MKGVLFSIWLMISGLFSCVCRGEEACTWPELLLAVTSASFRSSNSMMGSPSAFFKLEAIISGVQPEPS